jgi:hypothetical protein
MYDPISDFEFTKDDRKYIVNVLEMLDTLKDPTCVNFEKGKGYTVTLLAKEKK